MSMSKAQALFACAAIGAVAVAGTLAAGLNAQNNVEVYFDNGLSTPVHVTVGEDSFNVPFGAPLKRRMKPGSYEVVVREGEREIERTPIEIAKKELMPALLEPEFYVYNVRQVHIYRRATLGYAVSENERTYSEQIYPFQHFFSQPDADYVFEEAPEEIQIQDRRETREEFTVARDLDYNVLATMKYNEGDLEEATKAVEKALEIEPCHANALRNRVALLTFDGPTPDAVEAVRAYRDACDGAGVDAHRAYQDTMTDLGGRDSVVAEYRDRRRRAPSAHNDYLLARLLPGADALPLYHAALEKDPAFARARLALAYDLMGLERYREALTEIVATLDASMLVDEAASLYGFAAVAVGGSELDAAKERLRALANQNPYDLALWQSRWITSLARQDWSEAERLLVEYQSKAQDDGWSQRIQLLALKGDVDQARQRLDLARQKPELSAAAQPLQFQTLYAQGDYGGAASCFEELPFAANDLNRLYAAAGLAMAGRRTDAHEELTRLADELSAAGGGEEIDFLRSAAAFLAGRASEKEALDSAREAGFLYLPHAYFFIGARKHADGQAREAKAYFERSVATAVGLDFPYLAARGLAGN
jgi:hypothetical protein